MTYEQADYLRKRERDERAAAKAAASAIATRTHQDLAVCYCALLHGDHPCEPVNLLRRNGLL